MLNLTHPQIQLAINHREKTQIRLTKILVACKQQRANTENKQHSRCFPEDFKKERNELNQIECGPEIYKRRSPKN